MKYKAVEFDNLNSKSKQPPTKFGKLNKNCDQDPFT